MAGKKKLNQAVIVIHGMGEQVPMEMVRGFTDAVWVTDPELVAADEHADISAHRQKGNRIWSKPDSRNRSHELHRMTTESDINGRRTDFYEFYWAHRIHGTKIEQVWSWLGDILWRNPFKRVPADVLNVWITLWVLTIIGISAVVLGATGVFENVENSYGRSIIITALGLLSAVAVGWIKNTAIVKIFGDVVRYTKAEPLNIARRQEIREKGVELLETLMSVDEKGKASSPAYDRIIIVAHSLGTIVAYDILAVAFSRINRSLKEAVNKEALEKIRQFESRLEAEIKQIEAGHEPTLSIDEFQAEQAESFAALRELGSPWLVTDFITLGSPLTHAEFLVSDDEAALTEAQLERRFPTCPPQMELDPKAGSLHFTYKPGRAAQKRIPHHASLFAFTRWTNLYSPRKLFLWGDIVSGPVGKHFGVPIESGEPAKTARFSGIRDVAVLPPRNKDGTVLSGFSVPFMTHISYWNMNVCKPKDGAPHHIVTLRKAVNLLRKSNPWVTDQDN